MNKTRMGKRVASLLLSLVMMLSLLPTAAYATTMADGVDTQGASVSENGTGVSDDSNSSGNTDDLQVGDSKDSGDTGDQQVGGSSVSGTADDTTGAEGGADPTDSVNGTATYVAYIGETGYETLDAAITAAGDSDTVEVAEGRYTLNGSLTYTGKAITVKAANGANVSFDMSSAVTLSGAKITFENVTFDYTNADYTGLQHTDTVVYNNCTINGKICLYANSETFNGCYFEQKSEDYNVWTYGAKKVAFNDCTFKCNGKAVNVYIEKSNASDDAKTIAVNNCTVNSDKAGKAFLNIKNSTQAYDVTLSGTNTVTGLEANGTTGSALYQVETTEVTETTGKPVAVKAKADDGTVTTLYEVKETVEASVAEVNGAKYKSLQAAVDAAKSGATVTLLADTRENVTVSKNAIVLDLNGHTLNGGTENAKPALTVDNKKVTLKDSSEAQTGTIKREDTADTKTSHYVIDIQGKNGFMIVESGKVENNSGIPGVKGSSLIRLGNDSVSGWPTLTIKGGTFTQDNFIAIKVDRGTLHLLGGTVNSANSFAIENWNNAYIKGGTVNGTVSTWVYSTGAAFSKLEISGGTVNGNVASVNYDNAADKQARVYVTGGIVTGTLGTYTYNNGLVAMDETAKATIEVTGGTFSKDPTQYVVENSAITENDDGTFGVAKAYLAKIGDTEYYTMDEAFHAVKAGETIVMLRDYTTNKVQNSGDESFTIDLGGHTWTANIVDTASAAFEINYSDVTLTVKNGKVVSSQLAGLIPSAMGGTIKYDNSTLVFEGVEMTANGHSGIETNGSNTNDTVTLRNSTLNVPNGFGIYFPSSGTLTIDNSVINAKTMGVQVCAGSLNISGADTAITVSGDGIAKTENDGAIEDGAAISIVERTGYKGLDEIKVEGGKFTAKGDNAAVKAYKWENQTASAFDNSKNVVAISGGTFSSAVDKSLCADGFIPTQNADGTYGVKEGQYVAEVGSTKYATLQAAIDKAGRNATVRLLADTRENVTISTNYLTLDLNGHTLNGGTEKGKPALTVTARVTVKDSSEEHTGTIMREDTAANSGVSSHYVIDVQGAGWLTFESGNVKNNSGNDSGKGASLVRVGDDSIAKYPGLNIKGGTFTQDNFIVIKVDSGDLFLNGGTLNSANSYAIEDWHRATIKGGTVNGTVAVWTYSDGHNSDLTISGGTVNGNVASVSYDKAEGKVAKVSISGGTVNGTLGTYTYGDGLIPINDATKATIAVTGGTFSSDPTKYVVEDSGVTKNDDGTYGVAKAYLAKVGGTSYYTMDEAFKAQTASGEAIVLLRDYTTGSTFNSGTVKRTVDLNGHTWTCTGTDANSAAFEINNPNATLIVKNGKVVSSQLVGLIPSAMGGTIKYDNSSLVFDGVEMTTTARSGIETNGNNTNDTVTLKDSTLNVPNGFGIYFPSSGTLTIDNSVINAKTMGVQVCAGSLNVTGAGTAINVSGDGIPKTINDGAIEDGAAISIVNRAGYKDLAEIKVEGGKFTAKGDNAAVKAYDWANQTENAFTQSDKVSISGGTFSSAVDKSLCANGYIPTQNADGTYGVKEGKYVAEIGSQGYESLQEAIGAAQDGQTVTLLADAAEDVVISKSITLDLGGKTLTNTNVGKATISVQSGTVTVKNGNVKGGTGYYNIEAKKDANLTLTDVTATAGNTGSSMIDNWGTLTITSGTYNGGLNVVKSEEDSKLTITGGTFELSYATNGYTGVIFAYGDTTISGGEFIQSLTTTGRWNHPTVVLTGVVEGHTAITRVTGGHFVNKMSGESIFRGVGKATSDNFKVSGGTFNKSIPDAYCADGFIPTKNADGTYGVKEGQYVAEIGSKKYETLADAIRLAAKGRTITLLADVEQNTQLTIDKSITLDLNGKTIKNTADIWGDNANAILSIKNGAKVTITGNGTIDAKENDCYTINVVKGDLTIENGTFYGNVSVVQLEEGTLSVKGGTFDLHQKWEGSSMYLFNCIDEAYVDGSANVAISGGTFVGFDPNVSPEQKVDGKAPSFAAPGVGITRNENGSFTAVDGMTAQILDKDGNSVNAYNTLAEAVAAAQDGQTVRLLANVAESSIKVNANITIDLNKMTVTGSFVTYGEVTIQNGTIDVPDGKTNFAYGKLTLADVDITGKAVSSSLLSVNYNGRVTIDKDSTIVADSAKGDYPAVFIKGQDDNGKTYAPELNIYGTVQSAKTPAVQGNGTDRGVSHVNVFEGAVVKSESLAVYLPQPCEVNITGGLVEGYCGIGIKSGTLNISGGTVRGVANDNVIGDEYSQTNGISYDGSAIMIDSYIGYAGQVQINISGNAVVESKYSTAIREIGNDKSQTNLVGLDITGGTVLGAKDTDAVLVRDVTAKDVNISGGEFSSIVKKEYCAPGFTPVTTANSEGRYGVEIGMFTVMVTSRTTGSDSPVANVTGGGSNITYAEGTKVTASAISGYKFVGWFVNEYTGTPYSTDLACEVKPTADCTMIAVYEPISGGKFWLTVTASEFTVNGGAVQDSYLYEQFAVGASVTVNFTGSENFLYWVNASNKVVSTEKSYTFIMGSETTLKAVYGKARQNQATVVFISHSDQIISSKAYTTSDTIQFPVPPIKMGCTFTGWSMTESEIRAAMANNSGIIQVRARYTEPSIACKVTVIYPDGIGNEVVKAVVGKAVNVTAKDIEGKTFSYWTDNAGNVLGYTKTLNLAPSGDMTVKAVYDEAAEAKPVITISEVSATTANESYVVTFMATRAVPDGYKVVKQGILWSRDAVCGEDGAAAYMQFDSNGKLPTGVNAYIGNSLELNGVTRLDITTKYNDRTFYGRGYMVLESDAGELLYIYTNTIASGSYDSLTK